MLAKTKTNILAVTKSVTSIKPTDFYTNNSYDITKWITYGFDAFCPTNDANPIRLMMNLPNKNAIDNATIFIKEITFTQLSTTTNTDNYNTSTSTISATALTLDETYTSNTIKALTGYGTQVREYEGANGNVLTFAEATAIKAGTPYLIKPAKAAEKYIFNNVDITTTEAAKVGDGDIKFCGVYNQSNVNNLAETGSHVSGIVDNIVKRAKDDTSIKGFRAYFSVPNSTSESTEAALRVAIDGETTGIDAIEGFETKTPTRVYNLSGQYVGTSTANLKPGVYVSGGKKVIVK